MQRLVNPGKRLPDKAGEPDFYEISRKYPLPALPPPTQESMMEAAQMGAHGHGPPMGSPMGMGRGMYPPMGYPGYPPQYGYGMPPSPSHSQGPPGYPPMPPQGYPGYRKLLYVLL